MIGFSFKYCKFYYNHYIMYRIIELLLRGFNNIVMIGKKTKPILLLWNQTNAGSH